jgi:uncharacterized protein YlxW (UPF0749 family)
VHYGTELDRPRGAGTRRPQRPGRIRARQLLQAALASLKADVATLTSTVPVLSERLDQLEARVTAIEARLPA